MAKIEIASLFLYHPQRTECALEAFQTSSGGNKEDTKLVGIFELSQKNSENEKFLSSFIKVLERAYTASEGLSDDLASRFEYIVKQANEKLALNPPPFFKPTEGKSFSPFREHRNGFSAFLALLKDTNISFSAFGKIRGFLLYPTHGKNDQESLWKMIDVLESPKRVSPAQKELNTPPLFSQLLSGELREDSTLLFSTATLLDVLSLEYVKKTISKNPPEAAVERLEHFLSQLSGHLHFAAFIIAPVINLKDNENETMAPPKEPSAPSPSPSLKPQAPKKRLLAEKSFKIMAKVLSSLGQAAKFLLKLLAKIAGQALSWLWQKSKQGLKITIRFIKTIPSYLRVFIPTATPEKQARRFSHFPSYTKQILIALAVLLLLTALGLGVTFKTTAAKKTRAIFTQQLTSAQNLYTKATAEILYREEEKAKTHLNEAASLLQNIIKLGLNKDQKQQYDDLLKKITEETEKLYHLIAINTPKPLFSLASYNIKSPEWLLLSPPYFIVAERNTLYLINEKAKEKAEKVKSYPVQGEKIIRLVGLDKNTLLFLTEKNLLKLFDITKGTFTNLEFQNKGGGAAEDVASYGGRFYTLDILTPQIWRFQKTSAGFGQGSSWLNDQKGAEELKKSWKFTVDGSIYTVSQNGLIQKFDAGKLTDFSLPIQPTLEKVTKIWTSPSSKFLYVSDAVLSRLSIVPKDKKIIAAQYNSKAWAGFKDFAVDEIKKKIYILTADTLFEIEATHLK